jgi:hypothetical protein
VARRRPGVNELQLHVLAPLYRFEKALPHILAEKLARQETVHQPIEKLTAVLSLIELVEGPVQKIAWPIRIV